MNIISFTLIILISVILLFDIVPMLGHWLGRICIGRYNDKDEWNKLITDRGIKWLARTPKIRVTDNTRLVLIDILSGNYTRSAIQHWQEASLVLGLAEYLKHNNDKVVENAVAKFINSKIDMSGQWMDKPQYVDSALLAYSVMKLDFINMDKYKKAFDYIWELIKDHIGEDGTVEYRKSAKEYRYVDTIGLICPFLVLYGRRYNKNECIDLAVKQIKEFEKYGMLEKHYIPCHAYKLKDNLPMGLYGWGRGVAWFALGLIESWNELPEDSPYKPLLKDIIYKYSKAILGFQQKNGSWNWTVTRGECTPDSSATAALGWFMLNASRLDEISKECLNSTDKAVGYLMKVTRRNGAADFSQGDTKDIGVYSNLFSILPFTQGLCIRIINSCQLPRCNTL